MRIARQNTAAQKLVHQGIVRTRNDPTMDRTIPDCNWGVATGSHSGVLALDVDGEEGRASLAALEAQHVAVAAYAHVDNWTSWTAVSSVFSAVRWQGHSAATPANWVRACDVRGAGGYVIIPPSVHPSGRCYHWANPDQPIADPPRWLLDLLNGNSRKWIPRAAPIRLLVEGQRNDSLFRFGCAMRRRGATQDEIQRQLHRKNELECSPRLEASEICKIAASASRYDPGGPDPLEIAWGMAP